MTTRTFKQQGQAYGSTPASITVTLDGAVVYSGTVSTLDEPLPTLSFETITYDTDLFTWTEDVAFSGTKTLSISVNDAYLLLTKTIANYPVGNSATDGANVYSSFYNITVDGVTYSDPFTDTEIDGVPQSYNIDPNLSGQWWWIIPPNSEFTATVNIQAGQAPTT